MFVQQTVCFDNTVPKSDALINFGQIWKEAKVIVYYYVKEQELLNMNPSPTSSRKGAQRLQQIVNKWNR